MAGSPAEASAEAGFASWKQTFCRYFNCRCFVYNVTIITNEGYIYKFGELLLFKTRPALPAENKGGFMAENQMEAVLDAAACPKCGVAVAKEAIACPGCGAQVVKTDPKKIVLTLGQKIAAITLIVNGFFMIAEMFIMKSSSSPESSSIRSALVNIGIGAWLFSSQKAALTWAKIGAVLGGVLFPAIYIFVQHDYFMAGIQIFFSLALVGLLFGKAGKVRIGFSVFAILAFFALEAVGLYMEMNGGIDETPAAQEQTQAE